MGSDPESEPEPSSECRQPISVLPENIKKPAFGFCRNNECIICPAKTVGKVGECYACFLAKDSSKESYEMTHWHSKNNPCFSIEENIYIHICI